MKYIKTIFVGAITVAAAVPAAILGKYFADKNDESWTNPYKDTQEGVQKMVDNSKGANGVDAKGMAESRWYIFGTSHWDSVYPNQKAVNAKYRDRLSVNVNGNKIALDQMNYLPARELKNDVMELIYTANGSQQKKYVKLTDLGATEEGIMHMTKRTTEAYSDKEYWFKNSLKYEDGYSSSYNPYLVTNANSAARYGTPIDTKEFDILMKEVLHGSDVGNLPNFEDNEHSDMNHDGGNFDSYIDLTHVHNLAVLYNMYNHIWHQAMYDKIRKELKKLGTDDVTKLPTTLTYRMGYENKNGTSITKGVVRVKFNTQTQVIDETDIDYTGDNSTFSAEITNRMGVLGTLSNSVGGLKIDDAWKAATLPSAITNAALKTNTAPSISSGAMLNSISLRETNDNTGGTVFDYILAVNGNTYSGHGIDTNFKQDNTSAYITSHQAHAIATYNGVASTLYLVPDKFPKKP